MAQNFGAGIDIFPVEIWINIVKKIDNLYDVEKLSLAFGDLRPFLEFHLTKLKEEMVILLLLQNGFINSENGLKLRTVSKHWCSILDSFYSKPHVYNTCLPSSYFPFVTLRVPLDMSRAARFEDFVKHENCKFIGGRLMLMVSKPKDPVCSAEPATLQSVCSRVEHLTIKDYDSLYWGFPFRYICEPFVRQMCNLTSITFNSEMDVDLISYLPNPDKLAIIRMGDPDSDSDNWDHAFAGCKSNLKLFDCKLYTMGLQRALTHLKFESLLEFRAGDNLWKDYGTSHLFSFNAAGAKQRFPVLKRIAIPFFDSNHEAITEEDEWEFLERLIQVTNTLDTIEEIELRASYFFYVMTLDNNPVRREIPMDLRGSGSSAVRRLVLSTGFHAGDNDEVGWCFRFTLIWPSLRSLRIDKLEYAKKENEWRAVGMRSKCTECV